MRTKAHHHHHHHLHQQFAEPKPIEEKNLYQSLSKCQKNKKNIKSERNEFHPNFQLRHNSAPMLVCRSGKPCPLREGEKRSQWILKWVQWESISENYVYLYNICELCFFPQRSKLNTINMQFSELFNSISVIILSSNGVNLRIIKPKNTNYFNIYRDRIFLQLCTVVLTYAHM